MFSFRTIYFVIIPPKFSSQPKFAFVHIIPPKILISHPKLLNYYFPLNFHLIPRFFSAYFSAYIVYLIQIIMDYEWGPFKFTLQRGVRSGTAPLSTFHIHFPHPLSTSTQSIFHPSIFHPIHFITHTSFTHINYFP